jgi:photosystem II stability/assembly factor-like uncharacterized protein
MKKQLLIILLISGFSKKSYTQTLSPMWSTIQNTGFTVTSVAVNQMDAVDQNVLWALGIDNTGPLKNYNWFSKTSNGGASYTSGNIFPDTNTYVLGNIEGIDANNAWVSAYYKNTFDKGVVYHTTNGGNNWTNGGAANMYTVSGSSFIDLVCFLTPSLGITVGDPVGGEFEIYRTTDAGTTWSAVAGSVIPNSLPSEYGKLASFTKSGPNNIWFGTSKNRIFRSVDAGQTWSVSSALTSTLGAAIQITKIAFRDPNNGLAKAYFGSAYFSGLTLWKTTDGGSTWTNLPSLDPNFGRLGLCAIPGTSLYASCEGVPYSSDTAYKNVISYSSDDGATWNNWGGSGIPYYAIDFVSSNTGWAGSVSSNSIAGQKGIYKFNENPLGITYYNTAPVVTIYPNPTNGAFLTSTETDMVLTITNQLGQIVKTIYLSEINNHQATISGLECGTYFIGCSNCTNLTKEKIIVLK